MEHSDWTASIWIRAIVTGLVAVYLRYRFVDVREAAESNGGKLPKHFPGLFPHLLYGGGAGAVAAALTLEASPAFQALLTTLAFVGSREILGFSLVAARSALVGNLTEARRQLSIIDREGGQNVGSSSRPRAKTRSGQGR